MVYNCCLVDNLGNKLKNVEELLCIFFWGCFFIEEEMFKVLVGISEWIFVVGVFICMKGELVDYWMGIINGLGKMVSYWIIGKIILLIGISFGGWFGEGLLFKMEVWCYDVMVICEICVVFMNCSIFYWLMDYSILFNCYLIV